MMSVGRLAKNQETYYLSEVIEGREDYYLDPGEAPGRWTGQLAAELGLQGRVGADELRAVLAGDDPRSGRSLRESVATLPGLDLTLSPPKGVSICWALADREDAERIVAAYDRAVDASLQYLERHACRLRRGHAGAELVDGAGFVAAAFRRRTSRAGDPQLHSHVLVANMSRGPDGRWTALDSRSIYRHARTAGFVYQAVLRHELARSLGLLFEEVENGHADVAGVPKNLRRHFSTRRREIETAMERQGSISARGAQVATLTTRVAKGEHATEAELRERCAKAAAPFDFSVRSLLRLVRTPAVEVDDGALAERLTEQDASFQHRDVVRAVAQGATQGASCEDLEARADAFVAGEAVVVLAADRWTTPAMLALEQRTVALAANGLRARRGLANPDALAEAVGERPSLGADQRLALEAITGSGHGAELLIGLAGTGKTFMLDAA